MEATGGKDSTWLRKERKQRLGFTTIENLYKGGKRLNLEGVKLRET